MTRLVHTACLAVLLPFAPMAAVAQNVGDDATFHPVAIAHCEERDSTVASAEWVSTTEIQVVCRQGAAPVGLGGGAGAAIGLVILGALAGGSTTNATNGTN